MAILSELNAVFNALPLAELEVGQHLYWHIGNLKIHGQVFITSWFVIAVLVLISILATRNIQRVPTGLQNFMEYAL
jgi:F-type H+-transporting ATPase subunit a